VKFLLICLISVPLPKTSSLPSAFHFLSPPLSTFTFLQPKNFVVNGSAAGIHSDLVVDNYQLICAHLILSRELTPHFQRGHHHRERRGLVRHLHEVHEFWHRNVSFCVLLERIYLLGRVIHWSVDDCEVIRIRGDELSQFVCFYAVRVTRSLI